MISDWKGQQKYCETSEDDIADSFIHRFRKSSVKCSLLSIYLSFYTLWSRILDPFLLDILSNKNLLMYLLLLWGNYLMTGNKSFLLIWTMRGICSYLISFTDISGRKMLYTSILLKFRTKTTSKSFESI